MDGLNTSLEISNRKNSKGEPITIVGDFTLPYTIFLLSGENLFSEKIDAFCPVKNRAIILIYISFYVQVY